MDDKVLLGLLSTDRPVGLGGCRSGGSPFDACEYNVTVFDGSGEPDQTVTGDGVVLRISRGSLTDLDSAALIHYADMRILQDPSWELSMLLSRVREKRDVIFRDYAKNCLMNSIFCVARAGNGLDSDAFAACWAKSALVYLAYSILALNMRRPAPAHCMDGLRNLDKNPVSDKAAIISDCLGMERATPSLLRRMSESTVGFADETGDGGHSGIIRAKTDCFIENAMLADCYMYLTCVNHANFVSVKDSLHRNPDLIYILKVALDLENDREKLRRDLQAIRGTSEGILRGLP